METASSSGKGTAAKRVNRFMNQKWRIIPLLSDLEAVPKEYSRTLLWGHVVIDFLQVLSLVLPPQLPWGSGMKGLTEVLVLTQIPFYRIGSKVAFWLCLVLSFLVVAYYLSLIAYTWIRCTATKRYIPGGNTFNSLIFRIFRHTLYLFTSVLFLPILSNFVAVAYQNRVTKHLVWFGEVENGSFPTIISLCFCCIGLVLHVSTAFFFWNMCYESSSKSQHPLRRFNCTPDIFYLCLKLICVVLQSEFMIDNRFKYYSITTGATSVVAAIVYIVALPYYSETMLKIRITLLWLCAAYSILTGVSSIPEVGAYFQANHEIDLIVFGASLPVLSFFFSRFLCFLRVSSIYKKSIAALRSGTLLYPVVFFPKNLPRYPQYFSQNRETLKKIEATGFSEEEFNSLDYDGEVLKELSARREVRDMDIADPEAREISALRYSLRHFIMPYITYVMFPLDIELSCRFLQHFVRVFPVPLSGYQLRYAAILYIKGLHQFENSDELHLSYIHFLVDQSEQVVTAVSEVQLLEMRDLSLAVSYRLWRLEVEVTRDISSSFANQLSALDIIKEIHFHALQSSVELWHEMLTSGQKGKEDKNILATRSLMETRSAARKDYEALLRHEPGNLEALCCFAVFSDQLMNDTEMSHQCIQFVRQFVQNREVDRIKGSRLKASINACLAQLQLSLDASNRAFKNIQNCSSIKRINFIVIALCVLIVMLLGASLVLLVVKEGHVATLRETISRMGQVRTLTAKVGLVAQEINFNQKKGEITSESTLKTLRAYTQDFSSLVNDVFFGDAARASSKTLKLFRDQSATTFEGVVFRLWSFFGIALANMNMMLSSATLNDEASISTSQWLATHFSKEMSTASVLIEEEYLNQMEEDLDFLIKYGVVLLIAAILLEVVLFSVLFYTLFYMKGVRSTVFALISLFPKQDVRSIYQRVVNQIAELDVFLRMKPQEKINLVVALDMGEDFYDEEGASGRSSLLHKMFSAFHARKESSASKGSKSAFSSSFRPNREVKEGPNDAFVDFLDTSNEDMGDEDGESADGNRLEGFVPSTNDIAAKGVNPKSKRRKQRKHQMTITENEQESAISEQSFLLNSDKNSMERLFTPLSVFFIVALGAITVAIVLFSRNVKSSGQVVATEIKLEYDKNEKFYAAFLELTQTVSAVAQFAVSGEQRYFKTYMAAQSSDIWRNFHSTIISFKNHGSDFNSNDPFELENLHTGLFQVTDIVMRLLCSRFKSGCSNDIPFEQYYISSLTWGDESTLFIVQQASINGLYNTFFGVLEGSTVDLTRLPVEQREMAIKILSSEIFSEYMLSFFSKMEQLNDLVKQNGVSTVNNQIIAIIVLASIGVVLTVVSYAYNTYRKREQVLWKTQFLVFLLLLISFVGMIVLCGVAYKFSDRIDITQGLTDSQNLLLKWSTTIFSFIWYPLMYLCTEGNVIWNYKFMKLLENSELSSLAQDLKALSGKEALGMETIVPVLRIVMIPMVLVYEGTKNRPELAADLAVFSPEYLNNYQWDFEAQENYVQVLGTYKLVTPEFYSTRAADLAKTDAEKLELASATLVSYQSDHIFSLLYDAVLDASSSVAKFFQESSRNIRPQQKLFNALVFIAIGQMALQILAVWGLFLRYCMNMVSTAHISAVMMKNDSTAENQSGNDKSGKVLEPEPRKESTISSGGENTTHPPKLETKAPITDVFDTGDDYNVEIKCAARSVTSTAARSQGSGLMEKAIDYKDERRSTIIMFVTFGLIICLIALTSLLLILLPIYKSATQQYAQMIDESSRRSWFVVDTMSSISSIMQDESNYGVESERIRMKYKNYMTLIKKLYFGSEDDYSGKSYPFVQLSKTQDELLFSRNIYYSNQTFVGSSVASTSLDGIQIISTDGSEEENDVGEDSNYFCSASEMANYMGYYSRGVGLVAEGQWTDYLRRCFLYNYSVCAEETYPVANEAFLPLLTGLAVSHEIFFDFTVRFGVSDYIVITAITLLCFIVIFILYFFFAIPFLQFLLQEDTNFRLLLRSIPIEIRSRYPHFEDVVERKSQRDNQSDELHRVMTQMSRMSVFAIDTETGKIVRFNEMAEDMFGYATSEVLERSAALLLPEEGSMSDKDRVSAFVEKAKSVMSDTEMVMKRLGGMLFHVTTHFTFLTLSEGESILVAFMEELEDQMRYNTLIKINEAVLGMHDDGIIHIDSNGIMLHANRACTKLLGWDVEELIENNVSMLMPKTVAPYHDDFIKRYMEIRVKKRVDALTTVEALHRDGHLVHLHIIVKEIEPPFPSYPTQFVGYLRGDLVEKELEHAMSMADVLYALSPVPLVQVNAKGEVQKLSISATEMFQYKHSELESHVLPIQHLIPEKLDNNPQPGFLQRAQNRGPSSAVALKRDHSTFPAVVTVRQIEFGCGIPNHIFVGYILDISKTLRLEKNGSMTHSVMTQGIYPVIVMSKTGVINYFNDAACKCFKYKSEEMLGKSYRLLCCDDADEDEEGTKDWLSEGSHNDSFEQSIFNRKRLVYAKCSDGSVFPAELVMAEVPPINQNDAAVAAILRDLTEEMKIQRNYHMSELIDILCPRGIILLNPDGKIERFSPAAEHCFGYYSGELLGGPVQTIIPGIKMRSKSSEKKSKSQETEEKDDRKVAESSLIHPDGISIEKMVGSATNILGRHFDSRSLPLTISTAEVSSMFRHGDKSYVLYCENTADEGEIIETATFYRRIRDDVDSSVLRVDETGRIVYVNKCALDLFGHTSEASVIGKRISSLFSKKSEEVLVKRLGKQVREFKNHRSKSGMTQQEEEGKDAATRGGHQPVRVIMPNEIMLGVKEGGNEFPMQCSVVQVSSFLNGTVQFVFYMEPCDENVEKQVVACMNYTLVDVSSLPLFLIDSDGTVRHTSSHAAQALGYESVDHLIGMNLNKIVNTTANKLLAEYALHQESEKKGLARRTQQIAFKADGFQFPVEMDTRVAHYTSQDPVILISLRNLERDEAKIRTTALVRSMLELIRTPAVITNSKGTILNLNSSLLNIFGYAEKDDLQLIGKDIAVLMTENDSKYHHRYMSSYFASRVKYSIDNTVLRAARHRKGHVFYVNTRICEVVGASKDPKDTVFVGYFELAPDPSNDPSKVGKIISSSEVVVKHKSIMPVKQNGRMTRRLDQWMDEKQGIPFALLDKKGDVIKLSSAAEHLLGYFAGEADRKPLANVLAIESQDTAAIDCIKRAIEVISTKSSPQFAVSLRAKNRQGEPLFLNLVWRDISEFRTKVLKETELPTMLCCLNNLSPQLASTHFKLLCDATVESCRHPTIFMGTDGIVTLFNHAAEECFGYKGSDVVGKNISMLMPRKTADMHDRFLQRYLETDVTFVVNNTREVTSRRATGEHFSSLIRVKEVRQPTERFFVGQLEDISERKKDEVIAVMSRILMLKTESDMFVFDMRSSLIAVSPSLVQKLGERESAVLSQPNLLDQIFNASTVKIFREFVQPYQREAEQSVKSDLQLIQNFSSSIHNYEDCPYKRITAAPVRFSGGNSCIADIDIHVAICGSVFIGIIMKITVLKTEDVNAVRKEMIALGSVKYHPNPLCVVNRQGLVEQCSNALAECLGYGTGVSLGQKFYHKPLWVLFPSFPAPKGVSTATEESSVFVSMMKQIAGFVSNNVSSPSIKTPLPEESNRQPILRGKKKEGGTLPLQVVSVVSVKQSDSDSSEEGSGGIMRIDTSNSDSSIGLFVVEFLPLPSAEDSVQQELRDTVFPLIGISPTPMVLCDENGIIRRVNHALEDLLDFSMQQLHNHSINLLMPRGLAEMHDRYLQEYKATRDSRALMEQRDIEAETRTGGRVRVHIHVKDVVLDGNRFFLAALTPRSTGP